MGCEEEGCNSRLERQSLPMNESSVLRLETDMTLKCSKAPGSTTVVSLGMSKHHCIADRALSKVTIRGFVNTLNLPFSVVSLGKSIHSVA